MPKIILESNIVEDKYTDYICNHYDIQTRDKVVTIVPMLDVSELQAFKWNVGCIVGLSGSGKSTILRNLGNFRIPNYDYDKCVISQFPQLSEEEVCELLHGVGLSSIPIWLHKPNELSNGERYRLDTAWIIANTPKDEFILLDEWTSVINRNSAKSASFSLQRYLRKHDRKVVLASCHFDILEEDWLQPDWVYNLNKQENEECELERFIYSDDEEYEVYKNVNNKDILSEAIPIQ